MIRRTRRGGLAAAFALMLALAGASQASAATFTVNSTTDAPDEATDGVCAAVLNAGCTLRAAIDEANATPGADTIVLPAGVYSLAPPIQGPSQNDNSNLVGDLDVAAGTDLTIEGAGAETTTVSGRGLDRVLDVGPGATFKLKGVTLRDGVTSGDDPWLTELPPAESPATFDMLASDLPKGIGPQGPFCTCVQMGGGAGLRVNPNADVTLEDSSVEHNHADTLASGGGIANIFGDLTLIRTRVHRNSAVAVGGGIFNLGSLTIQDSTLDENGTILAGGALANYGTFDIDGSTINGNQSAVHGGGVFSASFTLPSEGALAAKVADAVADPNTITNSTVTENAVRWGGGGALYTQGDDLSLISDTIADNDVTNFDILRELIGLIAGSLTGVSNVDTHAAIFSSNAGEGIIGTIEFTSTIVSNGKDAGGPANCATDAVEAIPFTSNGHNIESTVDPVPVSTVSCEFNQATDQHVVDVKLGRLRDNGGPTETRALLAGSPALEKGADGQGAPATDQRGGHRPPAAGSAGDKPDVGAYEANSLADLSVDSYTDAPDAATVGKPLHYNAVVRNAGPDLIKGAKLTVVLPAGATVDAKPAGCTGDGPVTCDLGELAKGHVTTVALIVRPASTGGVTSKATVSAAGMTDTDAANDSASTQTQVDAAPVQQQQTQQQVLPPQRTPVQTEPIDNDVKLNIDIPKTVTLDEFFGGITVEADCGGEPCLRKFREHAAINTGATRIAGFNLTVSRTSLGFSSTNNTVKLRPCLSGSSTGRRHKRCLVNLRKAAEQAVPFKVKVVVSAVDQAGNRAAKKATITVTK